MRQRIYELQKEVFDVMEKRHSLALAIAEGKEIRREQRQPEPQQTPPQENNKNAKQHKEQNPFTFFFVKLKKIFGIKEQKEIPKPDMLRDLSQAELLYFAASGEKLSGIDKQLKGLHADLRKLEQAEEHYIRNEGEYSSILSQITYKEKAVAEVARRIAERESLTITEVKSAEDRREEEKTLLREGFYTGRWFRQNDFDHSSKLPVV